MLYRAQASDFISLSKLQRQNNPMSLEDFIIKTYVLVDDFLQTQPVLRSRGPCPQLSDTEVITMEIVGEFLGRGSDKEI